MNFIFLTTFLFSAIGQAHVAQSCDIFLQDLVNNYVKDVCPNGSSVIDGHLPVNSDKTDHYSKPVMILCFGGGTYISNGRLTYRFNGAAVNPKTGVLDEPLCTITDFFFNELTRIE